MLYKIPLYFFTLYQIPDWSPGCYTWFLFCVITDSVMPNYIIPDSCFTEILLYLFPLYPILLYLIPLLHVIIFSVMPGSLHPSRDYCSLAYPGLSMDWSRPLRQFPSRLIPIPCTPRPAVPPARSNGIVAVIMKGQGWKRFFIFSISHRTRIHLFGVSRTGLSRIIPWGLGACEGI